MHYIINTVPGKLQLKLNNRRRFLFCQDTSQLTSTRLLSFVTGRDESKSCRRENVLLWKIILQNILVHTRIIKIQMLNCYCQLSGSVIFRQYAVSQSECKIDRPRPGLPRVSPRPHTEALWTRLHRNLCGAESCCLGLTALKSTNHSRIIFLCIYYYSC
jgi:hypothetical protein